MRMMTRTITLEEGDWRLVWAILEAKACDAEAGGFDDAMTMPGGFLGHKEPLIERMYTAREARFLADLFKLPKEKT